MRMIVALFLCHLVGVMSSSISQFQEERLDDGLNLLQENNVQLEVDETGQCIYVKSEEGVYSFSSPGTDQVCGLFIIADPDKLVEFQFHSFDISCTKGGLLSVVDGWELNGQFFPSSEDQPPLSGKQYVELCGGKSKPHKPFLTSQNVGLLQFRVPSKGQGFAVEVKFRSNPKPCNVVLQDPQGTYTLRNYNRRSNCSVSVIFPLSIHILAASVGIQNGWPRKTLDMETGLISKCKKRGIHDFVEIRGGDGLDPSLMKVAGDFCGLKSFPMKQPAVVACGNTAVRLVSSGRFENSVTFSFDLPSDFSSLDLVCDSFLAAL